MTDALPTDEELGDAGLEVEVDGGLAVVSLARPRSRNSMTPSMWAGLARVGAALPGLGVRVVVLRGVGESFSAGLDRSMLSPDGPPGEQSLVEVLHGTDVEVEERIRVYQDGFAWLHSPDMVTIAAVHGHAIGGGFQLALACDLRVVADDVKFCMKEPALGLVPDLAGTKPLVAAVGYSRALELCATARVVGAEEAVRIGLAVVAVQRQDLDVTVLDLAGAILANPAAAVLGTKSLLQQAAHHDLDEQRRAERTAQVPLLRSLAGG